ncbi:hypothetical protein AB834_02810 [PVC group bacterium (ex Bugula neritina AB1)]|nr:hypothetical protein AB834_02810 [PVC group bacterium (ex Bugula neritina AB1)]
MILFIILGAVSSLLACIFLSSFVFFKYKKNKIKKETVLSKLYTHSDTQHKVFYNYVHSSSTLSFQSLIAIKATLDDMEIFEFPIEFLKNKKVFLRKIEKNLQFQLKMLENLTKSDLRTLFNLKSQATLLFLKGQFKP